jgi:transcriptional regulator with XRE-family HTH domain
MGASALSGSKLRARRLALGLRQGDVARHIGVSASYLNLIEHNRRRVPADVLQRLAQVLDQPPESFADGGGSGLLDDLRSVALAWPMAELTRADDFAQRFPGWAQAVLALQQRNLALDGAIAAVNDRMTHDPHLSAHLHEVLSAVSSVRSTTGILAETDDLEPEWQARFLRNLEQDSARLAKGAAALVRYLDTGGQIAPQGTATPQEEVEAWASAQGWDIAGQPLPSGLTAAARSMAQQMQAQMQNDRAALPDGALTAALTQHGPDPLALAGATGAPVFTAFRRLAFDAGAGLGLVACDASGTLTLRRPVPGFSLPRFGAACPLWPLFAALARPMQPIEALVEFGPELPGAPRFVLRAYGQASHPMGFAGPELRQAMMLIIPAPPERAAQPAFGLGSTCRTCQRQACPARREPSILASAPAPSPARG